MKIVRPLLLIFCASAAAWSATVDMLHVGNTGTPGFYIFQVDGKETLLICDEFDPNVTTSHYTAWVSTLADLTNTTLVKKGDPDALKKYTQVAILDSIAFASPNDAQLATDVTWANRKIVDGSGPLPGNADALYTFVQTADPTKYDLSGFRIYTAFPNFGLSQEQTGDIPHDPVPEPATMTLIGGGLFAVGWRKLKVRQQHGATERLVTTS